MSAQPTILEMQARTLREFVIREQQRQSAEVLAQAHQDVVRILRDARRTARTRMREAIAHERARTAEAIAKARATQQTELRKRRLTRLKSKLDRAWSSLPRALEQRWQRDEQRIEWCVSTLALARDHLLGSSWQIYAAPGLRDDERQRIANHPSLDSRIEILIENNDKLRAGLVVTAPGAILDASIDGLLRDRPRIEALLVASLETLEQDPP